MYRTDKERHREYYKQQRRGTLDFEKQERYKKHIESRLEILVDKQREELGNLNLSSFLSNSAYVLLDALKQTARFQNICLLAEKEIVRMGKRNESQDFKGRLAGKIFAEMACSIIAAREYPERIVLSPERTTAYYEKLYPDQQLINYPFAEKGMKYIPIPDALLIENDDAASKIIGLIEAKASMYDQTKIENQYKAYKRQISENSNLYPDSFSKNCEIIFVSLPSVIRSSLPISAKEKNVSLQLLPFANKDLRVFVDEVNSSIELKVNKKEKIIFS